MNKENDWNHTTNAKMVNWPIERVMWEEMAIANKTRKDSWTLNMSKDDMCW